MRARKPAGTRTPFSSGGPSDPNVSWWHEIGDATIAARVQHNHVITVTANDFNTDPTGEAATNRNMPPYVAVQFIIRVL